MPLTQTAPREPGCSGFGAILVTLPSSMVRNEPHSAEHSQQVLGTISFAGRIEGRTFIAISSVPRLYAGNAGASGDMVRLHFPLVVARYPVPRRGERYFPSRSRLQSNSPCPGSHDRKGQGRYVVGRTLEIVAAGREFHHLLLRADEALARALVVERRDLSVGDDLAAGDVDILYGAVGGMEDQRPERIAGRQPEIG